MTISQTQVSELYTTLMGRASEGKGSTYWQNNYSNQTEAATAMLGSAAVAAYFGNALDTDASFVEHLYLKTLNKTRDGADGTTADADGITYWAGELSNNSYTRAELMIRFINEVNKIQSESPTTASQQFTDRVEVSNYSAENLYETPGDYKTSLAFNNSGNTGLVITDNAFSTSIAEEKVLNIARQDMASFNGHYYEVVTEAADFFAARDHAESKGGQLVIIDSTDENDFVYNLLLDAGITTRAADGGGAIYSWLGATDEVEEDVWQWLDDNPVDPFTALWGFGEPDDFVDQSLAPMGQDYVAIALTGWPYGDAGEWNDLSGQNDLSYVIEY